MQLVRALTCMKAASPSPCAIPVLQQTAIGSTSHTQNDALAMQGKHCPPGVMPAVFVDFMSMRAGHLMQLSNLSRVLEIRTLPLHDEGVFALLAELLWKAR